MLRTNPWIINGLLTGSGGPYKTLTADWIPLLRTQAQSFWKSGACVLLGIRVEVLMFVFFLFGFWKTQDQLLDWTFIWIHGPVNHIHNLAKSNYASSLVWIWFFCDHSGPLSLPHLWFFFDFQSHVLITPFIITLILWKRCQFFLSKRTLSLNTWMFWGNFFVCDSNGVSVPANSPTRSFCDRVGHIVGLHL